MLIQTTMHSQWDPNTWFDRWQYAIWQLKPACAVVDSLTDENDSPVFWTSISFCHRSRDPSTSTSKPWISTTVKILKYMDHDHNPAICRFTTRSWLEDAMFETWAATDQAHVVLRNKPTFSKKHARFGGGTLFHSSNTSRRFCCQLHCSSNIFSWYSQS